MGSSSDEAVVVEPGPGSGSGFGPELDWIPPLLRYFGEYHSRVVPRVEECCGLPVSDALLGGVVFVL